MRRRAILPSEHERQVAFFQWWPSFAATRKIHECLCFAVPNGGHRHPAVAGKLKAEGVRSGVCDVLLLVPASGFHGLLLEFKTEKGRPKEAQEDFLLAVRQMNYNALIVRSTEEAIRAVQAYLKGIRGASS